MRDETPVVIRSADAADEEEVRRLLIANGWADSSRIRDRERFQRIYASADRAFVACRGPRIVGYGRALTDGVSNGYISLLVVEASQRREGIGRRLVDAITGDDPGITWVLRAGKPDAAAFWRGVGFRVSEVAMERVRSS